MQKITPFLWFDTNCEEALNFYTSVFPDSKIISIERYPDRQLEGPPPGMQGKVLTAVFELFGQRFMALDGGPYFKPTEAVSFYVECETQEELDSYWKKLSFHPESEQCGWLKDKYGFSWQIIPNALPKLLSDPDKAKSARVMDAMLQMKKIDIATLEEAYESDHGKN
jgi:predicted 3-demethylubiquinone-9 3-methyltransferase (glyoxalase superfamily)